MMALCSSCPSAPAAGPQPAQRPSTCMAAVSDLPLVAIADSSPLFCGGDSPLPALLARLTPVLPPGPAQLRAAYLGTSNGDIVDYFELAQAAMQRLGLEASNVHFIRTVGAGVEPDLELLRSASIIVLSGGDPVAAMNVWESNGVAAVLRELASELPRTCLMIGVSAGAMVMARWVWAEASDRGAGRATAAQLVLVPGLGIAPEVPAMGMHEEKDEESWGCSRVVVEEERVGVLLGVPFGGIALIERGGNVLALRRPLLVLHRGGGQSTAEPGGSHSFTLAGGGGS